MQCKSVLIVEDDTDIRDSLRQALEIEGYQTYGAANGKEGLKTLDEIPKPCVILLDLMMPVMDGWQFVDAIRGKGILATIPVLVVSAFGDAHRKIEAQGFIKKPIDLYSLLRFVSEYCH